MVKQADDLVQVYARNIYYGNLCRRHGPRPACCTLQKNFNAMLPLIKATKPEASLVKSMNSTGADGGPCNRYASCQQIWTMRTNGPRLIPHQRRQQMLSMHLRIHQSLCRKLGQHQQNYSWVLRDFIETSQKGQVVQQQKSPTHLPRPQLVLRPQMLYALNEPTTHHSATPQTR